MPGAVAGLNRFTLREIGGQRRHLRVLDNTAKLRGYPVSNRQLAVTDLGYERSTLLLTNQFLARAADLIDCYVSCKEIENGSADSIDVLHMDASSSEVPLKIDAGLPFTTMADTLYRLRGLELFQRFIRSPAPIRIQPEQIEVRLGHRARNLLHIAAGFREDRPAIGWLGGRPMHPLIGLEEPNLSQPNR